MSDDTSVRVALRIRPQIAREIIDMCRVCTYVTPGEPQVVLGNDRSFTYDYVFDTNSEQTNIYESCVRQLVDGCFEGYNATVFAYGQTGSGKTFTMGTAFDVDVGESQKGIVPRAVHHLFEGINERKERAVADGRPEPQFDVQVQFIELYNEEILDLLDQTRDANSRNKKSNIRIHEDANGNISLHGVTAQAVKNEQQTMNYLRDGALCRTTASTNMNDMSSRSHAVFSIVIQQRRICPATTDDGSDNSAMDFEELSAKFHFVDLAGSERLKRTGATGERAREGISINCGLLALGNVISALGDETKKASHVPYRDSKLTRLLQDSLGGNSRTIMIACISPSDCDFVETLNTLKYANRARNIKNKVVVNQDKSGHQIAVLRGEIQRLQLELAEYKQGKRVANADGTETINDMYHENVLLQTDVNQLRIRVKALQETVENLRSRNAGLLAQMAAKELSLDGTEGSSQVSEMIQKYMGEIEELRCKLVESENTCEVLRRTLSRYRTPQNSVVCSPLRPSNGFSPLHNVASASMLSQRSGIIAEELEHPASILDVAKADVEHLKVKLQQRKDSGVTMVTTNGDASSHAQTITNGHSASGSDELISENESDSDSDDKDEDDDAQKFQQDLADLQCEISIKERLISELEQSQRRMRALKDHYEEKLAQLGNKIKDTELERDRVLGQLESGRGTDTSRENTQKIRAEYEKRLTEMKSDLSRMKSAQREHTQLSRQHAQDEQQLKKLQAELHAMKSTKVQLVQKMKEESNRVRLSELKHTQEVSQLKKDGRRKENLIKQLEAEKVNRERVLKRRQEEIAAMRQVVKPRSGRPSPRVEELATMLEAREQKQHFSPKVAKQRWTQLEKTITIVVTQKQNLSYMEAEMERLLQQREEIAPKLASAQKKLVRLRGEMKHNTNVTLVDMERECEDEIENLNSNLTYVQSNIVECQQAIVGVEGAKDPENGPQDIEKIIEHCSSVDEAKYLISHLYSLCISQGVKAMQSEGLNKQLAAELQQSQEKDRVHQTLLKQIIDVNPVAFGLSAEMTSSAESGCDPSSSDDQFRPATEGLSLAAWCASPEKLSKDKARRRTATTEELLFASNGHKPQADILPTVHEDEAQEPTGSRTRDCSPDRPASSSGVVSSASPTDASSPDHAEQHMVNGYVLNSASSLPPMPVRDKPRTPPPVPPRRDRQWFTDDAGVSARNDAQLMPPPAAPMPVTSGGSLPPKAPSRKLIHSVSSSRVLPSTIPISSELERQRSFRRQTSTRELVPSSPLMGRRALNSASGALDMTFSRGSALRNTVAASVPTFQPERNVYQRLAENPFAGCADSSPLPSGSGKISLYNPRDPELKKHCLTCTHVVEGHQKAVLCVHATDEKLATGSKDRCVKIFDLRRCCEISTFGKHPNNVVSVLLVEEMHLVLSCSLAEVRLFDLRAGKCMKSFTSTGLTTQGEPAVLTPSRHNVLPPNESYINHMALNSLNTMLFTAASTVVRIWDLRKFQTIGKLNTSHAAQVNCLAVASMDNRSDVVFTGSKDHTVKVFDVPNALQDTVISARQTLSPPHYDGIKAFAFRNGALFAASHDPMIKKFAMDPYSKMFREDKTIVKPHKDPLLALRFLPAPVDHVLVSACKNGTMRLWDSESIEKPIGEVRGHSSEIYDLASNSTHLFTASGDSSVGMWIAREDLLLERTGTEV